MSFVAVAIGGAAVIGGGVALYTGNENSNAMQNAANTQAGAANNATNLQYQEYQQQRSDNQPYTQAGYSALSQMQNPQFTQQPTQDQIMQYADPSMNFQMQQGEQALQASAAARGQTFSGNTLEAINNYAQNTAQTGYQNAFNNYYTAQNTVYNRLAGIAGIGQNANNQTNQAGQNYANNAGSNMMGAANAQAAGQIGSTQAQSNGLMGIGNNVQAGSNNWMQYSTLNNLMGSRSNNGGMGSAQFGQFPGASTPDAGQFTQPTFGSQLSQPSTLSSLGG